MCQDKYLTSYLLLSTEYKKEECHSGFITVVFLQRKTSVTVVFFIFFYFNLSGHLVTLCYCDMHVCVVVIYW